MLKNSCSKYCSPGCSFEVNYCDHSVFCEEYDCTNPETCVQVVPSDCVTYHGTLFEQFGIQSGVTVTELIYILAQLIYPGCVVITTTTTAEPTTTTTSTSTTSTTSTSTTSSTTSTTSSTSTTTSTTTEEPTTTTTTEEPTTTTTSTSTTTSSSTTTTTTEDPATICLLATEADDPITAENNDELRIEQCPAVTTTTTICPIVWQEVGANYTTGSINTTRQGWIGITMSTNGPAGPGDGFDPLNPTGVEPVQCTNGITCTSYGNVAPSGNVYYIKGNVAGIVTLTFNFSSPITDPILGIWSLGSPATQQLFKPNVPFVELPGCGFNAAGPCAVTPTDLTVGDTGVVFGSNSYTISGNEGYGIVQFPGTHSQIQIQATYTEYRTNFAFGILCDSPGAPTTTTSSTTTTSTTTTSSTTTTTTLEPTTTTTSTSTTTTSTTTTTLEPTTTTTTSTSTTTTTTEEPTTTTSTTSTSTTTTTTTIDPVLLCVICAENDDPITTEADVNINPEECCNCFTFSAGAVGGDVTYTNCFGQTNTVTVAPLTEFTDCVAAGYTITLTGDLTQFACNQTCVASDPFFNTVVIGDQVWSTQNFDGTTFRNGDPIPQATNSTEWNAAAISQTPIWAYYNYDPSNGPTYGKLYNWYVGTDPRGITPDGWRVPTLNDYLQLANQLGGESVAGFALKSTTLWAGGGATNSSGFTAIPSGSISSDGSSSSGLTTLGVLCTSTGLAPAGGYYLSLNVTDSVSTILINRNFGAALRFVSTQGAETCVNCGTTTTTSTSTSTSTTSTTTTLAPLDFNISFQCFPNGVTEVLANGATGGSGTGYEFSTTYFTSEAAALANTNWILTSGITYVDNLVPGTYWVSLRDSIGNIVAKSVTTNCTTTTTSTSTTTTTTTEAPTTTTTSSSTTTTTTEEPTTTTTSTSTSTTTSTTTEEPTTTTTTEEPTTTTTTTEEPTTTTTSTSTTTTSSTTTTTTVDPATLCLLATEGDDPITSENDENVEIEQSPCPTTTTSSTTTSSTTTTTTEEPTTTTTTSSTTTTTTLEPTTTTSTSTSTTTTTEEPTTTTTSSSTTTTTTEEPTTTTSTTTSSTTTTTTEEPTTTTTSTSTTSTTTEEPTTTTTTTNINTTSTTTTTTTLPPTTTTTTVGCDCQEGVITDNNIFGYVDCQGNAINGDNASGQGICIDINQPYGVANITVIGPDTGCQCGEPLTNILTAENNNEVQAENNNFIAIQ